MAGIWRHWYAKHILFDRMKYAVLLWATILFNVIATISFLLPNTLIASKFQTYAQSYTQKKRNMNGNTNILMIHTNVHIYEYWNINVIFTRRKRKFRLWRKFQHNSNIVYAHRSDAKHTFRLIQFQWTSHFVVFF